MRARGVAYRRAYKNAIKMARNILYQKVGEAYEIFHGNQLSYEDFIVNDPVEKLWERFVEYEKLSTKSAASVSAEIEKSIRFNFAKHLNPLLSVIEKYDIFFHELVYHMRYKEHISIPEKIGAPETLRKNEIITEQPTLPSISKADQLALDSFLNTWNKAIDLLQNIIGIASIPPIDVRESDSISSIFCTRTAELSIELFFSLFFSVTVEQVEFLRVLFGSGTAAVRLCVVGGEEIDDLSGGPLNLAFLAVRPEKDED
ncbi:5065_t:CDS:2 [Paraglomus occultum]|uniref:5065_t:CDS:1 n=1 Tax=Paraglomus occultum TaxID=144539 RepID=A0A9N9CL42_9GLOM|nr:5065_t:CDS:2 [Paraglomus occultum]